MNARERTRPFLAALLARANAAWRRVMLKNAENADEKSAPALKRHDGRVLWLTSAAIGTIVVFLFAGTRMGDETRLFATAPSTTQAVSVVTLQRRTFQPRILVSGDVRPERDIQVAAPATGVRILQILVDEGDTVREGQPMARLDASLAAAQTRAAEASVAEAESSALRARREHQRAEAIRDAGALSAEGIEQRRFAARAAEARLAAARAQLAEVNARLGGGYVRAPASGLVIDRTAELGRSVDGQVLFRIAVNNRLEAAVQVAEADVLSLREGQTAVFSMVDGAIVHGELRRLPASIDSRTRLGEALFALPEGTSVRAGMHLRGYADLPPREMIAAPQSSILFLDDEAFVFVLDRTNAARRTHVQLGRRDGDWVEVVQGLEEGQRIVGAGAAFLHDGQIVRIPSRSAETAMLSLSPNDLRGRE